jgi:uncharacterized protein (TIRG00374 family)
MKRGIKFGVVVVLNALFLAWLYSWVQRNVSAPELLDYITAVPVKAVAGATVIVMMILAGYAVRLGMLMDLPAASRGFPIVCIGFGLNNVLPFRTGDAAHVYAAKKLYNLPYVRMLMAKVIEKCLDLVVVMAIGVALLLLIPAFSSQKMVWVFSVFWAGLVVGLVALWQVWQRRHHPVFAGLKKYELVRHFTEAFRAFLSNPRKSQIVLSTLIIWAMTGASFWAYFTLALPAQHFTVIDILALVFLTTLSFGIPAMPAGLGAMEASIVYYLTAFKAVGSNQALATALILHGLIAVPQILLMLAFTTQRALKAR